MDELLQRQAVAALQRRAAMVAGGQRPTVAQLVKDVQASGSWAGSEEVLGALRYLHDHGGFVTSNPFTGRAAFGIRVVTSIDAGQLKKLLWPAAP